MKIATLILFIFSTSTPLAGAAPVVLSRAPSGPPAFVAGFSDESTTAKEKKKRKKGEEDEEEFSAAAAA